MTKTGEGREGKPADPAPLDKGTEAEAKGGKRPAQDQAEHDWQESAKESGE